MKMSAENPHIPAEKVLNGHGIKATPNRLLVARTLLGSDAPLTLSELETILETMDRSSIFRCLSLFKEARLVHVIEDGCEGVRYEICHSDDAHHDSDLHLHFHCTRCHKTYCFTDIPVPKINTPEGFTSESVNFVIKGTCPSCRD